MNRRQFIGNSLLAAAGMSLPTPIMGLAGRDLVKLTILHTNDVHSRIDPFPDDHKRYPGMGGAAARAALIDQIRQKEEHVLLLDAGDIFQGTPYFNFFGGELEFKLMNKMKYDVATIGNHDFDGGIDGLERQVMNADFPLVNCNYDFGNTILDGKTKPYTILKKGRLKVGITGAGVELDGLVPGKLFKETKYVDPVNIVNDTARMLKEEQGCDLVIVLSHLGYQYDGSKVSDVVLAKASKHIDLIIGGHTHTFLEAPVEVMNQNEEAVLINQVGWAGVYLGRIDLFFHKKFRKKYASGQTVIVDKKSIAI